MCFRPASITEKRCSKCGTANELDATVCTKCGTTLSVAPGMGMPGAPAAPKAPKAPTAPKI